MVVPMRQFRCASSRKVADAAMMCRFNLLFRAALGLYNLNDQCPSIDTYYGFYRALAKDEYHEDLFEKCFKQLPSEGIPHIRQEHPPGQATNIAFSRYEIIHETFVKSVTSEELKP